MNEGGQRLSEGMRRAESQPGAGPAEARDPADDSVDDSVVPLALTPSAERARLDELEAENARLLRLVGELLVVNQKLRERSAT